MRCAQVGGKDGSTPCGPSPGTGGRYQRSVSGIVSMSRMRYSALGVRATLATLGRRCDIERSGPGLHTETRIAVRLRLVPGEGAAIMRDMVVSRRGLAFACTSLVAFTQPAGAEPPGMCRVLNVDFTP